MNFRLLKKDEIDVRISQVKEWGVSVLLYKDARCDMKILDETVGPENWQRSHEVINNNLFCNVGIWVDRRNDGYGEWVWKQDVGTESYTEAQKGEASDSFKRACFNWGIGRELYTAPNIMFKTEQCTIKDGKCYDKFYVDEIEYRDRKISWIKVVNNKTKAVFTWGKSKALNEYNKDDLIDKDQVEELEKLILAANINREKLLKNYELDDTSKFNMAQFTAIKNKAEKAIIKEALK